MRPIKNFGRFLLENTLFDPGTFESTLKDTIGKAPEGAIYIEKQLSIGTVPHMKMISKKLGLHVVKISAESIENAGKGLARFLVDEPIAKTLVIFDDVEKADEKTIDFINDLIETRKVFNQKISDLYYFAEVHLIDRSISNYKNDTINILRNPLETTSQLKQKETDSTI